MKALWQRVGRLLTGVALALSGAVAWAQAAPAPACTRHSGPVGVGEAAWAAPATALQRRGAGTIEFLAQDGRRLKAHVFRPSRFDAARGPLWFVMHGVERDAARYIDAAAAVAERHQALAIAIEFTLQDYPASEDYTLGITTRGPADGAAAREGRLRPPQALLYNEVERLFAAVRAQLGGTQAGYYLFGHSAGAQFAHRLLTFVPCARVLGAVAANAGWYTLPGVEGAHALPYTLRGSGLEAADMRPLLAAPLTLLLGMRDTTEPAADRLVRGTPGAMAQGPHRLARGQHYFATGRALAQRLGAPFHWRLVLAPGAGHDARQLMASAGHWLFTPTAPLCSAAASSTASSLAFTEVLADAPPGATGDVNGDGQRLPREEEFVELVNTGPLPVCLTGWTLQDASGRGGHLFPLGPALAPGQAMLVFGGGAPTGAFGGAQVQRASASRGLALDGRGDVLTLSDAQGHAVARLSWGDCSGQPCAGDHFAGSLRLNGSLARWPGADGAWRVHRDLAGTPFSPGSRSDGRAW